MKLEEMRAEIADKSKITELITDYMVVSVKDGRAVCDCPFCKEKNSFAISDNKNMYKCFGCNDENDIVGFIAKMKHLSLDEACKEICSKIGMEYTSEYTEEQLQLFEANRKAANYFYNTLRLNKEAQMYLKDRGLTLSTIKHFGLGFADNKWDSLETSLFRNNVNKETMDKAGLITVKENGRSFDRFRNRIMFPIMNEENRVLGFGGRVMQESENEAKYLNTSTTEIFNKRNNLFALNFAKDTKHNGFILCEGYMDVISLHQAGYDNAVASLGTAFTREHAFLIRQYTDKVYLSFDNDEAGIKAKLRAIPILRNSGLDVQVLDVSPYKDPDEFIKAKGSKAFLDVLSNAENSYHYEARNWMNLDVRKWMKIESSFENKMKDMIAKAPEGDMEQYEKAFFELTGNKIDLNQEIQDAPDIEEEDISQDEISEEEKDIILKNITDEYEIH